MPTEIKLVEGDTVTVTTDYRTVYAQLLGSGWQEPCEFLEAGNEPHQVTVNPTYIVYFRAV
jgi:hypothetical protein